LVSHRQFGRPNFLPNHTAGLSCGDQMHGMPARPEAVHGIPIEPDFSPPNETLRVGSGDGMAVPRAGSTAPRVIVVRPRGFHIRRRHTPSPKSDGMNSSLAKLRKGDNALSTTFHYAAPKGDDPRCAISAAYVGAAGSSRMPGRPKCAPSTKCNRAGSWGAIEPQDNPSHAVDEACRLAARWLLTVRWVGVHRSARHRGAVLGLVRSSTVVWVRLGRRSSGR
jgi:hypothetical protein